MSLQESLFGTSGKRGLPKKQVATSQPLAQMLVHHLVLEAGNEARQPARRLRCMHGLQSHAAHAVLGWIRHLVSIRTDRILPQQDSTGKEWGFMETDTRHISCKTGESIGVPMPGGRELLEEQGQDRQG
jgi:hypothetical protein